MLSFLLTFLDLIVTSRTSIQEAVASAVSSFDPFLSMMESNFLLPASCWDVCVRGGGTQALIEFIINKFLSWGREWSWSVYLLSCSFKDLTMKAASPPKPLSFPRPPHSCPAAPVSSHYGSLAAAFADFRFWIGRGVSADECHGNYGWQICSIFIPYLSSLGFTPSIV